MRTIVLLLVLSLVIAPIAFAIASFQPRSSLPDTAELTPALAAQSKQVLRRARAAATSGSADSKFVATQAEMDSLIATLARVAKPLRGRTQIDESGVTFMLSGQVPGLPAAGWVNLGVKIATSDNGLNVNYVQLGRMSLPPELTVSVATFLLNALSTEDIGTLLLTSVKSIQTSAGTVVVTLDSGGLGEESLLSRVASGVRESIGFGDSSGAKRHYTAMSEAAAVGILPSSGSVSPWLGFALQQAANGPHESEQDLAADVKAALIALAAHCGDKKAMGIVAGDIAQGSGTSACNGTTLAGRRDLRRHFTLSSALQAAGGSAASFGLGEVKELVDAGKENGSGFSFDDIAADRAGIRFAETARSATADQLNNLAALATQESTLMPSIDGLDSLMSEAEFQAKFGGIDTPEYNAMIERIDARIDALPFFNQ